MSIKVNYLQELNIIESVFEVEYTLADMKESAVGALELSNKNHVIHFLVDCSRLKRGLSVFDLYSMGEFYAQINFARGLKQAVVFSGEKELEKNTRFYETTVRNRGYDVKAFADREKAIEWLLSD